MENVYRGTRERERDGNVKRESESVLMHERRDSCNEAKMRAFCDYPLLKLF